MMKMLVAMEVLRFLCLRYAHAMIGAKRTGFAEHSLVRNSMLADISSPGPSEGGRAINGWRRPFGLLNAMAPQTSPTKSPTVDMCTGLSTTSAAGPQWCVQVVWIKTGAYARI